MVKTCTINLVTRLHFLDYMYLHASGSHLKNKEDGA